MKSQPFKPVMTMLAAAFFFSFAACSPANSQTTGNKESRESREKKARNFDDVLVELDRSSDQLEKELKKPLLPIPPIDTEKIRAEVAQALKEVDAAKLQTELQASISKIDFDKMKTEIAKIKDIELPKIEAQMKEIRPQIEKSLQEAKVSIEKAKIEVKEYKAFEEGLEKDGLIDKENYTIEHKDGTLIINGKTQSSEVYNKYRSFLQKHDHFKLRKNDKDFDLQN